MQRDRKGQIYTLCLLAMMIAIAFVSNYIRFPFLGSQITAANAICALCGLIFPPMVGFLTAGIGALLYDVIAGYGLECLITFVSKGMIALVAGLIVGKALRQPTMDKKAQLRLVLGCVLGALSYVALYMLKTFVFGMTVNGLTMEATGVKMLTKLPASLINALFTSVASPILMNALRIPLQKLGVLKVEKKAA